MDTKAKCILAMVAMCLFITPAFSQGGERDGPNGNPGANIGSGQDNAMMSGSNEAPFGQEGMKPKKKPNTTQGGERDGPNGNPGSNIGPGQDNAMMSGSNEAPFGQEGMKPNTAPIKPSVDKPEGTHIKPGDGQHDDAAFGFGFGGPNEQAPHRSIMDRDHPQVPPKKSMMEMRHHHRAHKGPLKPLKSEDLPELPPMKSIMHH